MTTPSFPYFLRDAPPAANPFFQPIALLHGRVVSGGRPLWDVRGKTIEDVDADSFEVLGERFFRDRHRIYVRAPLAGTDHVYFYGIDDADLATFQVLNRCYAKDARRAYYVTQKSIASASITAFRVIPCEIRTLAGKREDHKYACDAEHVYYAGRPLREADPATFTQWGESRYFADKAHLWFDNQRIEGADRSSFIVYDEDDSAGDAATDRFRPYWAGTPRFDAGARELWGDYFPAHPELRDYWWHAEQERAASAPPRRALGDGYAGDGRRIYLRDIPLEGLDAPSFRNLGHSFCCDRNGMYSFVCDESGSLEGGELPKGDPATLAALGFGYFKDKNNGYHRLWNNPAVPFEADTATLIALSERFAKDRNAVYFDTTPQRDIDAATAVALNSRYVRDKQAVFYFNRRITAPIDPASCVAIDERVIRDAQGSLVMEAVPVGPPVDGRTLTFLNRNFARDRRAVYLVGPGIGFRELAAVDKDSFAATADGNAWDKHRRYDAEAMTDEILLARHDATRSGKIVPLPEPPAGWFDYAYAVLMDGTLALIRAATAEPKPWNGGRARLSVFDGHVESQAIEVPLGVMPMVDRLADGRWLVAAGRAGKGERNARLFTAEGRAAGAFVMGDAIAHIRCAADGTIWAGYFDEGGIARFAADGRVLWEADAQGQGSLAMDCYALALDGNTLWSCLYPGFPIIRIEEGAARHWSSSSESGVAALAIDGDHVLLAGGYGDGAGRITLLRLEEKQARRLGHLRFQPPASTATLVQGQGAMLHIVGSGRWQRLDVATVCAALRA